MKTNGRLYSPLCAFATLQVEKQRGDDLVHVLRVPDVGLQLIIDSLPHHTLQALDTSHTDPKDKTQTVDLTSFHHYIYKSFCQSACLHLAVIIL